MKWQLNWYCGLILLSGVMGCHAVSLDNTPDVDLPERDSETDATQVSGFVCLPARQTTINEKVIIKNETTETKLFYTMVFADERPEDKPLIVVLNGGPSVATSSIMFLYGIGPYYIDILGDGALKKNPYPFNALGNLLFIDTRQVGFSYGVLNDPSSDLERRSAYNYDNFSIFTDAGDILLAVLEVMAQYDTLQNNPVVLLVESYGGARAAMMHAYLSNPADLAKTDSQVYDPALAEALKSHFAAVLPNISFEEIGIQETSRQFGWQILLQPGYMLDPIDSYINTTCSDISSTDLRAEACVSKPDSFDLRMPDFNPDTLFDAALNVLMDPVGFETVFGVAPDTIDGLGAPSRKGAFRHYSDTDDQYSEWAKTMGDIPEHDAYYLPKLNTGITLSDLPTPAINTVPFIHSLAHLNTFISYAYYDGVVESVRIKDALMAANEKMDTPLIDDITIEMEADTQLEDSVRPGWMHIRFSEEMGVRENQRTVRMPRYDAGHMISLTDAGLLWNDIKSFLLETGALF